jgi:hypothetical protein
LSKISDDEFAAIWEKTYGYLPQGSRAELAKDYVAEQYDEDLDGCIAVAESSLRAAKSAPTLKPTAKSKSKSHWLPPR